MYSVFLILNFRSVLNVVCFLLGSSAASEFYMPSYLSAYEDGTECSETSAYKIQTPGNYPEESIQHVFCSAKRSIHATEMRSFCAADLILKES